MTTETKTAYVCNLTNGGWQLYSYADEEGLSKERARSKRRGKSLSLRLTKLVAGAKAKIAANPMLSERKLAESVRDKMHKLLSKYSEDGATDTEPTGVLVAELERAFGLEEYSLERW